MSFIENVNLIANYIRQENDNIYEDINLSVQQGHDWASLLGSEPDPSNFPGELSAQAYAIQAGESLEDLQSMTVDADTLETGEDATAVYDPATNNLHFGLPKGDTGIRGSFWYMLPNIPTIDVGRVGDAGLNTTTFDLYYKVNISGTPTWTYYGNIKGEQGDQGIQGDIGDEGPEGPIGPRGIPGEPGTGLYPQTEITVAEMNALDLSTYQIGSMWLMEDSGTVVNPVGSDPIIVTAQDWVGLGADGFLMNLGAISGPEGPQGIQGEQGDAATVDAGTATSIAFGSTPTVDNSGTTSEAIFDFGIPLGETGVTGDKGDTGDTGDAGEDGIDGTNGIDGLDGELWYLGTANPSDTVGVDGDLFLNTTSSDYFEKASGTWQFRGNLQGIQGIQGIEGPASVVAGPVGPGSTVDAGTATGLPAGATPTVDNSGTDTAAVFDFGIPAGEQGIDGAKGDTGDAGIDGIDGAVGTPGEKWYLVSSDPTTGGLPGDLALNTSTSDYFENQANVWVLIGNLIGGQGDTGETGLQGTGGTVAIGTTTTLLPGEDATVNEAVGSTPENAIFDFGIPEGVQGLTGAQGDFTVVSVGSVIGVPSGTPPGVTDGDPGDDVLLNFTLEAGVQGDKGDKGDQGDIGLPGLDGRNGEQWYLLISPPTSEGLAGDLALDTITSLYYENQSGTWIEIGTLKGITGDTGTTGSTGLAATISVTPTTITGNAGTDASVANTGTTSAADYEFTIPRGDKGDKGAAGTGLEFKGYEDPAVVVTLTATVIGECYTANVAGVDSDGLAVDIEEVMVADDLATPSHWVNIGAIQGPQGIQGETGSRGPAGLVPVGERTVAEINSYDFSLIPTGTIFIMTDAGTITTGPSPIDVVVDDWLGKTADDVWVNMGPLQGDTGASGEDGADGIDGTNGATGAAGEKWFILSTDPTGEGIDGDLALNTVSSDYFEKITGAWVLVGNLQGIQGIQGATGEDGIAATISVTPTTITGVPGTEASVTNTGTTAAADYEFTIPRGDVGAAGTDAIAPVVSIGSVTSVPTGTTPTVIDSDPGVDVILDFTLEAGVTGNTGEDGIDGTNGTNGAPGEIWYVLDVPPTTQGINGDLALDQVTYEIYEKALDIWTSIGNIKGDQGDIGTPGLDGSQGDPGTDGIDGDDGLPGADGAEGPTGPEGPVSTVPGPEGDPGTPGTAGADGTDGLDGATWLILVVDPIAGDGVDGDLALNTVSSDYFQKITGTWILQGNLEGAEGAPGTPGTNGTDGDDGLDGGQGTPGVAATITVGVISTGLPGSDVIITDTDPDASAATFDFTIPRGDDGTPGPSGPSAVSTDAGNLANIGSDTLIYVGEHAIDGGTY